MTNTQVNNREIVLDLLLEWEKEHAFSHQLIRDVLNKYDYLPGQEKAFIKRLAEGTIERQIELDYILNKFSSVPTRKMKPLIRCLMRMTVYQIFYMNAVPDAAAVSEAVKLAGKRKFHNLKGFVNGVLRNVVKQKDTITYPDPKKDPAAFLSVHYSMPLWIVEFWTESYGSQRTEQMLKGLMEARPVTIRLTGSMDEAERQAWIEKVQDMGVKVKQHPKLPYALNLEGAEGVASLPGYHDGKFAVQDASSMLAVEAAQIGPGDFVLDVCAAPGGKTMLAAEKVLPGGRVEARDVSERKTDRITENLERMGLANVSVKVYDASVPDPAMEDTADVVLADVPCSGLGVMGKKRDIKYHVTKESLESLNVLQKAIVTQAASYVKKGGVLLYSTCTVNKQENEDMVDWICTNFPYEAEESRQLFPGIDHCDGFFFARLRKK